MVAIGKKKVAESLVCSGKLLTFAGGNSAKQLKFKQHETIRDEDRGPHDAG